MLPTTTARQAPTRLALALLSAGLVLAVAPAAPADDTVPFIRPRQEGRFQVPVGKPVRTPTRVIGTLAGREVLEIDSPARVSGMGKVMAADRKGGIWFLETREDKAIRLDPVTLEMVEYQLPRGSGPYAVAIDSRDVLWITAHGIEMLLELRPEERVVVSHAPPSHGFLIHVNVDRRDDTVYFCQPGANLIVSYHRERGFREYRIPSDQAGPGRLDFDSAGHVWFPELYANKVARLDPRTGRVDEWNLPTKDGLPSYVRVDASDAVWVSMPMADLIVRFKDGTFREFRVPTINSVVSTTVADADGAVWFTEGGWRGSAGGNKIGRLDPTTGRVEEFTLPTPNAQPLGMIIDRDGTLWLQQSSAGKVTRLGLPGTSRRAER